MLTFVTGNANKLKEVLEILGSHIELKTLSLDRKMTILISSKLI